MIEKQNAEAEYKAEIAQLKAEIAQTAPVLGKWLSILFWLNISTILANIIANKYIEEWVPTLYLVGLSISALCTMARGLVLLRLGLKNHRYIKSGGCCLAAETFRMVCIIFLMVQIYYIWNFISAIISVIFFVGEYYEYTGHAEVLQRIDFVLSEKWRRLWKWYIGLFVALIGSVFLVFFLPLLGLLAFIAIIIGIFIVVIFKYVYLYRTARLFQEYS